MRKWWAGVMRDRHLRKMREAVSVAETYRKAAQSLTERARLHERKARQWQLKWEQRGGE